jgi:hypothetical protein
VESENGVGETRIRALLDSLVAERQDLRRAGVDHATLEANRLAIVYWQQALTAHVGLRARTTPIG